MNVNAPTVFLIRISSKDFRRATLRNPHQTLCKRCKGITSDFERQRGMRGKRPMHA